MIPGLVSKLSEQRVTAAATLFPKTDVLHVTGTTALATLVPAFEGFSGLCIIVAQSSGYTAVTTGNIQTAITFTQFKPTLLIYSKVNAKWYSTT